MIVKISLMGEKSERYLCLPKIHMFKPNPQWDGSRRWSL